MPQVFITHESLNFNYTQAEKFGEICFLTGSDLSVHENSPSNRTITNRIRKILIDFTETDYLLPSGSPLITGLAMAILHERFNRIQVLKWSNQSHTYTPMVVCFDYYN